MGATVRAIWNAQANNSYYRITELALPAMTSTGLHRFDFKTAILPHKAGRLLIKSQGHEWDTEIAASQPVEFVGGTEAELVNMTGQELKFTVVSFK
jgi:hypothetical protein